MRYLDLTEGPNDPNIFKAVILAGGPGSGKSYVADKMGLNRKGLRIINSDDALEYLMRKSNLDLSMPDEEEPQRNLVRDRAKQMAKTKERLAIDGRLGLIIDGTAKDVNKVANVKKKLEQLGYQVMMLFVNTSLRTSLERNNQRPRRVPINVVTKSHNEVQKNKQMLSQLFGSAYVEINNEGNPDFDTVERKINAFLAAPLSSIAKDWTSKQKVVQEDVVTETRQPGEYVYHATVKSRRPEQLIRSLISYGLRPSKDGYAGPGAYFAYEPDEGYYHMRPEEAVILRVKWQDLVDMYGVYPSNPDGIERDDEQIIVPGGVPSTAIEIELKPGVWLDLQTALSSVLSRYTAEAQPADSTLAKIKERWAQVNPSSTLHEDVTPDQLKQIETYADVLFSKVGIDVGFTRHFIDRVNDSRNRKPITAAELVRLFREEYLKWGRPIARLGPDAEAVMRDMQTDVNMPFVLNWNRTTQQLELKAKTVMRKADFKTPDPVFAVESTPARTVKFTVRKGKNKFATELLVNNESAGMYQYDANTGRSIAEIQPEFRNTGLGKLLVLHAIYTAAELGLEFVEDESRTSEYDNVVDSLINSGYIVNDDEYLYVTDTGEQYLEDALGMRTPVFAVESASTPKIIYHGNQGGIDVDHLQMPMWFSTSKDSVMHYAGDDGFVVVAELRPQKTLTVDSSGDANAAHSKWRALVAQGYDTVMHQNGASQDWIILDPDCIAVVDVEDADAVSEALTLPIPRNQMPQIDYEHVKDDFRTRRGTVAFGKLVPVQTERVPGLVDQSIDMILANKVDKPIMVDKHGYIVNGHHRYDAYQQLGVDADFPVPVVMVYTTLEELIDKYSHTSSDDDVVSESTAVTETTAGSIASVAMPLGGLQRRPNPSIYNHVAGPAKAGKKKK